VLELKNIFLTIGKEPDDQTLLNEISTSFPQGHFTAILGPSGCGKSTLLKVIAGLMVQTQGSIQWGGRDLAEDDDLQPHEIGYVPQFSITSEFLSVWENVDTALRLRVGGISAAEREKRTENILKEVGLDEIADRQVRVLSGGQKRRLALALEISSQPVLMLADEVTSGLDPKAEDEIVRLMKKISQEDNRIVLSVTHSLRHIDLYDSVMVLYQGHLVYHGPGKYIYHYFNVDNPEDLFPSLTQRTAAQWHASWRKHHASFPIKKGAMARSLALEDDETQPSKVRLKKFFEKDEPAVVPDFRETKIKREHVSPDAVTQFFVLLSRRWRIFLRDRSQLILQLALMLGFPCLVVIFALDGLPAIQNLSPEKNANPVQQLVQQADYWKQSSHVGSLVSGLVMFQVILLTLMGSNNSAREIAGERLIFEKEKFAGLKPASYVASKAFFLSMLVALQSIWMAVFVNVICRFPGDLLAQIAMLMLVNAAMTAVCLGISATMKTAEQASLVSIYLVGFQLPLSGAVLALPKLIGVATRPFIASYWSWSGFIETMRDTRFYDVVQDVTQTKLSPLELCIWVLASHVVLGLFFAYVGCKHSRWE
jgi:ABC transport system ATP-binding/permease protein